jgi:hypothetical protein
MIATVRRPLVDLHALRHYNVSRVSLSPAGPMCPEWDVVDEETGVIVYTTPETGDAKRRAVNWIRRHGLTLIYEWLPSSHPARSTDDV